MTAREAAVAVIRPLLDAAERNLAGIAGDAGSECLHDFRVAVRRLRTLLGQFKKVFPQETVDGLKIKLSYLGRISNKTRDLDVFLGRKEVYSQMLPAELHDGMADFFRMMENSRRQEFAAMTSELKSERCLDALKSLRALLEGAGSLPESKNSHRPAKELASLLILRKFKDIQVMADDIGAGMDDSDLHRLRILCKHLRYLIEFFSSLFPAKDIAPAVDSLKELQDQLGLYNDCSVQQRQLAEQLDVCMPSENPPAAAMRSLLAVLQQEKDHLRPLIRKSFGRFCGKANSKRFKKLF